MKDKKNICKCTDRYCAKEHDLGPDPYVEALEGKSAHNSNSKKKRTKVSNTHNEHPDYFFMREIPVSSAFLEKLGDDYLIWALDDSIGALKPREYFLKRKISTSTLNRWRKRCEIFNEKYELGVSVIGDRRETGGLTNKLNASLVSSTLRYYDKEYRDFAREEHDYKEKVKADLGTGGNAKFDILEMPVFVKEKKDD